MLSERRYWNPYNFSRLLGYRSTLVTVVRSDSVLKQLQVAMSLLFSIFARGGTAWYYNMFVKSQNIILDDNNQFEIFSLEPVRIKTGLQIFYWHPGSLSNHKYLAFRSRLRVRNLFNIQPSFKLTARKIAYRPNKFMRNYKFKRKFKRPFWQRRNRFWRPKRLSRIKFIDTRRIFLRKRKIYRRLDASFKALRKVSFNRMKVASNPLKLIYKLFYRRRANRNFLIQEAAGEYEFNRSNRIRDIYAYAFYRKPEKAVVPELDTIKPGTPENPNVLPVDNMPTASIRRRQRKKRKLEMKLYDPYYSKVAETFFLLKDLFFSKLVYKEKRWFSFAPFLIRPRIAFVYKGPQGRKNKLQRRVFNKRYFAYGTFFNPFRKKRKFRAYRKFRSKRRSRRKMRKMRRRRLAIRKHGYRKVRSFFFRHGAVNRLSFIRKLIRLSCRMSRQLYRSRDFVLAETYLRHWRVNWAERRAHNVYRVTRKNINPYYKFKFTPLALLTLTNSRLFALKFDYINQIRYMKKFYRKKYVKKRKLIANTLCRLPGTFNFSLKKRPSINKFENFFNYNPLKKFLTFSKKTKARKFEKSYTIARNPSLKKNLRIRLKRLKWKKPVSKSYKIVKLFFPYKRTIIKMRKRRRRKKKATKFEKFGRYKKATRLFPSIMLVASLSRYALSVLNESQCVGVSLIYFTDAAVSPLCNLFNVVMNSDIHILTFMEVHINSIFNKAKVFNLISRVW